MFKRMLYYFISFILLMIILATEAKAQLQTGVLNIDGNQTELIYIEQNNKRYYSLDNIALALWLKVALDDRNNIVVITYPDGCEIEILLSEKQLIKEHLKTPIDIVVNQNNTYIAEIFLKEVTGRNYFWDNEGQTLYLYLYAYPKLGESILGKPIYQGIGASGNNITFEQEGQIKAGWSMNGELLDLRLLRESTNTDIKEYEFAAFYLSGENRISQLLITQRILPNGDRIVFTTAYSADKEQYLSHNITQSDKIYGSIAYIYLDRQPYHTLVSKVEYSGAIQYPLKTGESVDIWYIFAKESLEIDNPYVQRQWDISKKYHQSNAWVTPMGTYRGTPAGYQKKINYKNYNINLQASVPLLLMETLEIEESRLLEDMVHNAKFTLFKMLGEDGFWHSGISVDYLNKAYQLGPDFIDTRMSVDASLFLLKYGLRYSDNKSIEQAKAFKNYFRMLKNRGIVYRSGNGFLYSDYYSDEHSGKTIASLNHSLYELNYLYTLYNLVDDDEAKAMADEILKFISNSQRKWIAQNGDLNYAISPMEKYFGKDYINITYMDLFVAKSLLDYMGIDNQAINGLYQKKGEYLKKVDTTYLESQLNFEDIYNKFDRGIAKKGDIFLSYPLLELNKADGYDFAYFSYGTYYFIKGVTSVRYKGEVKMLDPAQKYIITIRKSGMDSIKIG